MTPPQPKSIAKVIKPIIRRSANIRNLSAIDNKNKNGHSYLGALTPAVADFGIAAKVSKQFSPI